MSSNTNSNTNQRSDKPPPYSSFPIDPRTTTAAEWALRVQEFQRLNPHLTHTEHLTKRE